jgi:hypothetical protein
MTKEMSFAELIYLRSPNQGVCMSHEQMEEPLTEPRRKEIFLALVDAQDHEMTVVQSRKLIADRFGLKDSQIRDIEREGLDNQWPPL